MRRYKDGVPARYEVESPRRQQRERLSTLEAAYGEFLAMDDRRPFWVTLATYVANMLSSNKPLWVLLVGPPSCGKSATLSCINELPRVFQTGALTEAGLLSGTGHDQDESPGHGGMLRQIGETTPGLVACKDFGSILSMDRSARARLLAALREVHDGSWIRRLGAGGGLTLEWSGKAGLIGGVTPEIDRHQATMASMGERFLMYRFHSNPEAQMGQTEMALTNMGSQEEAGRHLQELTADFMGDINLPEQELPFLPYKILNLLVNLSRLVSTSRSAVDRDCRTKDILTPPEPEYPTRLALQLRLLFHGLILIGCRAEEAWATVFEVGLSSMPVVRRRILQKLATTDNGLPSRQIADGSGCSKRTIQRELESLQLLGVTEVVHRGGSAGDAWHMSEWAHKYYLQCESGISGEEHEVELALIDPLRDSQARPEPQYASCGQTC